MFQKLLTTAACALGLTSQAAASGFLIIAILFSGQAVAAPLDGSYGRAGGCALGPENERFPGITDSVLYVERDLLIGWEVECSGLQTGENVILTCYGEGMEWTASATVIEDVANGTLEVYGETLNLTLNRCD